MKKIIVLLFCFIRFNMYAQQIDNPIGRPLFNYKSICVRKGDTIFCYKTYLRENKIDSIVYSNKLIRQKRQWIGLNDPIDSSYVVAKCIKMMKNEWFKENNAEWFNADSECDIRSYKRYYPDGRIQKYWRFGALSRTWIIYPRNK